MARTTRPLDRMLSDRAAQPTGEDRTPAGPLTTLACKRRQFNYSVVKWTRQLDALCACAIRRSDRCHVDSWLARPQKCMDSNVSVSRPLLDAESGLPNPLVRTQYKCGIRNCPRFLIMEQLAYSTQLKRSKSNVYGSILDTYGRRQVCRQHRP